MPPAARAQIKSPSRLPAHGLLLQIDLRDWAGAPVAQGGRRDALLGRVEFLRLAPSGRLVEAAVRGDRPAPHRVQVWVDGETLKTRCTCPDEHGGPCKHAVAAIEALRFPLAPAPRDGNGRRRRSAQGDGRGKVIRPGVAQSGYLLFRGAERTLTREERVQAALEEECSQRRSRARRERAEVIPLPVDGGPARFTVEHRRDTEAARVTLRGPKARLAACTCADFADNELGTCRHVERVRSWYLRKKKHEPGDLLSVWWRPRGWTDRVPDPLQEIRVDAPGAVIPPELERHFDPEGWLRPAPDRERPDAWAEEALHRAEGLARRHGFLWDLDRSVLRQVESARERSVRLDHLRSIDTSSAAWRAIQSRLGFRLHPYQEMGALFLARTGRAMLADEMGLGKTLQAIVAALLLRAEADARKALVVCPASLKHQWRREIHKAYDETARVVEGSRATRLAMYEAWQDGFLILNYELVLRDLEAIQATRADLVILDEAQRIKNWDTKTARSVKRLHSPYAFILTGTPLENRLHELHSLAEFLHPRALGPRWRLLPFHAVAGPDGRILAYEGLEVLRRRLREFFLRRERRAVLDQLPERTDNVFWTGMTPLQRRPYRRYAKTVGSILSRPGALLPGELRALLQALTGMRILCNAHAQHDWQSSAERVLDPTPPSRAEIRALGSPKLEEFAHVLEDLLDDGESKIVVFSQWERMLRLAHFVAREELGRRELRADVFHGRLTTRAREEMLEAFRVDPEFHVLFSTDAGGLGLNLQESASIVINLEVPWNPAVLEQRVGRVYRLGQRRSVQVLHMVTRGAIEERVRQVVESKRALFEGVMADDVDHVVFDDEDRSSFVQQVRRLMESGAVNGLRAG